MDLRKTIIIMLVAQMALLLFLSARVIALERQALGPAVELTSAQVKSNTSRYAVSAKSVKSTKSLKQEDIRLIVREEMEVFTDRIVDAMDSRPYEAPKTPAPMMDPRDISAVKATITAQIGSYSGQGIISPNEMAKLEHNIARLPRGEQIKALSELNRAINNGQIEARF